MLNILKYICYTLFINQRVYLTRLDISRFKKGITSMFKIDERLPKESAKDYVVRQLVYNIVHINLTPGQQLDSDEISELLNVSKNPIREAELELSQTRLIEIKPKIGAYVSLIDANIIEEVRELRSVLEAELAALACTTLNKEQINMLWENVALWQMYMKRNDEEKIFQLDKEFHKSLYKMCNKNYWYELVNNISPHFDRTTILSFRCISVGHILSDHEELVAAIENRETDKAREISKRHLNRYTENINSIKDNYAEYFKE